MEHKVELLWIEISVSESKECILTTDTIGNNAACLGITSTHGTSSIIVLNQNVLLLYLEINKLKSESSW